MPVLTHPARPDIQRLSGLLVLAGPSGAGPAFRSELEAAKQWDPGSSSPHSGGPKCTGLVERAIRLVLRQHGVSPERPLVDAVAAGAAAAPTLNKLSSLMGGNWKSWHDGGELAVRRWRGALFPRPYLTHPPPPLPSAGGPQPRQRACLQERLHMPRHPRGRHEGEPARLARLRTCHLHGGHAQLAQAAWGVRTYAPFSVWASNAKAPGTRADSATPRLLHSFKCPTCPTECTDAHTRVLVIE